MKSADELPLVTQASCQVADTRSSSSIRVKASCGHITEPLSLKAWAKSRIDTGICSFPCETCKKEWVWQEVCKLALFTEEERDCYEKKLIELTKDDITSYKKCPDCNFLVQRMDPESLCVECLSCSNAKGKLYQFCWECMREWKNPASRNKECGNKSCSITAMLLSCPLIEAPSIAVHQCPVVRACPNCETLVSHCQQGCPLVTCPNCFYEFCYRCLGIEGCKFAEFVELRMMMMITQFMKILMISQNVSELEDRKLLAKTTIKLIQTSNWMRI
ncbi:uncharacterized protein LOC125448605 [Stegostoma tigrinum]|uniref:uncharacterized protein LOC125448605 n=1 Tax=Stegostoma tigrinum TaxID=3053191 RepID=UPI0028705376|nr:uncharacterized protein LOC125448605 [Stegostoma tigrinum]